MNTFRDVNVRVDRTRSGSVVTVSWSFVNVSSPAAPIVSALTHAGLVMDHSKVLELMQIEDSGDMEHAWSEIGRMAKDCAGLDRMSIIDAISALRHEARRGHGKVLRIVLDYDAHMTVRSELRASHIAMGNTPDISFEGVTIAMGSDGSTG